MYRHRCTDSSCNSAEYIGYTLCSLAKRFYTHVQTGSIRLHNKNKHNCKPLTQELLSRTDILYRGQTKIDVIIAEALLIKQHQPNLNMQDEGQCRVLKIF